MDKFTVHPGLVAPMDRANVDTDAIIPKQFLKSIARTGFGPNLFDEWRYLDKGEPGQDPASRKPNPDFVLNQSRYQGASVLLARENFGCGSSREHAPWALEQYGFRAIIAPSYADIFFNNCFKNGLLPIVLPESVVARLFDEVHGSDGVRNLKGNAKAAFLVDRFGATFTAIRGEVRKLIVGQDDKHGDVVRARIEAHGLGDRIALPGPMGQEELWRRMCAAAGNWLMNGFGGMGAHPLNDMPASSRRERQCSTRS